LLTNSRGFGNLSSLTNFHRGSFTTYLPPEAPSPVDEAEAFLVGLGELVPLPLGARVKLLGSSSAERASEDGAVDRVEAVDAEWDSGGGAEAGGGGGGGAGAEWGGLGAVDLGA